MADIYEALFADDLVLFANSAEDLQKMITILDEIVNAWGQEISIKKTKIMIVQGRGMEVEVRDFYVRGQKLENVFEFRYLGGMDTRDARMTSEIDIRCQRMQSSYFKYNKTIFLTNLKNISESRFI